MDKMRVCLVDADSRFLRDLMWQFIEKYGDAVDIHMATDTEAAHHMVEVVEDIDVLVVHADMYDTELGSCGAADFFVLMEMEVDPKAAGALANNLIYRQQSADKIFEIVADRSSQLGMIVVEEQPKNTKLVLFAAATGGMGCSTLALALCSALGQKKKKALYIGAGVMQTHGILLQGKQELSVEETHMLCENIDEYENWESLIEKGAFHYLPATAPHLDSSYVEEQVYTKAMLAALDAKAYDYVVVDIAADDEYTKRIEQSDYLCVVAGGGRSVTKKTMWMLERTESVSGRKDIFVVNNCKQNERAALMSSVEQYDMDVCEVPFYDGLSQKGPAYLGESDELKALAEIIR